MIINKITRNPTILSKTCILCGKHFETTKKAQLYCDDNDCKKKREKLRRSAIAKKKESTNLVIRKGSFDNNKVLQIQCHATSPITGRCCEKFNVLYQDNRTIYPKYCHKHANTYQRQIFEGKGNASAEFAGNTQTN